jgi:hypothetical protein
LLPDGRRAIKRRPSTICTTAVGYIVDSRRVTISCRTNTKKALSCKENTQPFRGLLHGHVGQRPQALYYTAKPCVWNKQKKVMPMASVNHFDGFIKPLRRLYKTIEMIC